MYTPTHLQVTVQRAKGLLTKGKNGTNNCYTTISLGKEKYQTSLKENSTANVDWHEECELAIPSQGNRAELVLTCHHRNNFGIDEFLGQLTLPLNQMDQFERPRSRWFKLMSKPGHDKKDKDRGELEIRTTFVVKAGSLSDLSKKDKNKSSLSNIAGGVGGSLLSLGTLEKRKTLKKFAKSLGSKMHVTGKRKKERSDDSDSFSGSLSSLGTPSMISKHTRNFANSDNLGNADPGVISEDEDEFVFDNLSHKSSGSSLNLHRKKNNLILTGEDNGSTSPNATSSSPSKPARPLTEIKLDKKEAAVDEWEAKLYGKSLETGQSQNSDSLKRRSWEGSRVPINVDDQTKNREKTIDEQSFDKVSLSSLSPRSSPQLKTKLDAKDKARKLPTSNAPSVPSAFAETGEKELNLSPVLIKSENKEKGENIFSKKWNKLKKDINPMKEDEEIKNQFNSKTAKTGREKKIIGGDYDSDDNKFEEKKIAVPKEAIAKYSSKSKEEIIKIAHTLENDLMVQKQKNKELEEYLDVLLLRVMETHPRILQNPFNSRMNLKQSG